MQNLKRFVFRATFGLQKNGTGAGEVAQWVRPLAAVLDNLSSLLQTTWRKERTNSHVGGMWGGQLEETRRFLTKPLPSHMVGLQL